MLLYSPSSFRTPSLYNYISQTAKYGSHNSQRTEHLLVTSNCVMCHVFGWRVNRCIEKEGCESGWPQILCICKQIIYAFVRQILGTIHLFLNSKVAPTCALQNQILLVIQFAHTYIHTYTLLSRSSTWHTYRFEYILRINDTFSRIFEY